MKARILKACCITVLPGSVVEVSEGQFKALGAFAEEVVEQAQEEAAEEKPEEEKPAAKKTAPKAKKKEA